MLQFREVHVLQLVDPKPDLTGETVSIKGALSYLSSAMIRGLTTGISRRGACSALSYACIFQELAF